MLPDKSKNKEREIPVPATSPEITVPADPEVPPLPVDEPELIPEEDPFENPPPFEAPEPGEGP